MSNDEKFKKGDVVMLKSGGPHMTVSRYTDNGRVVCIWFDESQKDNSKAFEEATLELLEEDDDIPSVMTG